MRQGKVTSFCLRWQLFPGTCLDPSPILGPTWLPNAGHPAGSELGTVTGIYLKYVVTC